MPTQLERPVESTPVPPRPLPEEGAAEPYRRPQFYGERHTSETDASNPEIMTDREVFIADAS
jgi:hypothetical protein